MSIKESIKQTGNTIMNYGNYIDWLADSFIVKPSNAQGIGGFVFTVKDEDRIELRSNITDYVMESNVVMQDHISLKPMMITLRGFIGEVKNEVGLKSFGLNFLDSKLTDIAAYLPPFAQGAVQAAQNVIQVADNAVKAIDDIVDKTQNMMSVFGITNEAATAQEQAFKDLSAVYLGRNVMTVETPWGYHDNMAIESIVFEQDGKTNEMSDIVVTLKQLRFATVAVLSPKGDGRNAQQKADTIAKGKTQGNYLVNDTSKAPWVQLPDGPMKDTLNYVLNPSTLPMFN